MNKYDDIINLEHHTSQKRQRMPIRDRAAQFAPFAALTGYDNVIEETARQTDAEDSLNEENAIMLDRKLRLLNDISDSHPYVEISYFIPDERKSGGRYETVFGYLKSIDTNENCLVLMDKRKIFFSKIRSLDSTAFNGVTFE